MPLVALRAASSARRHAACWRLQLLVRARTALSLFILSFLGLPWRRNSTQSIVLGASQDSAKRQISAFMLLCRFLLADRLAPEALRPLASHLLFGDPLMRLPAG
jgi:hypothetical protein